MPRTSEKLEEAVARGEYARKQLVRGNPLIRWSHTRRFAMALRLASSASGKRVLDFGCGDGTFLALLMNSSAPPSQAVGADVAAELLDGARERFAGIANLDFIDARELDRAEHAAAFDRIVVMEVFEHMIDPRALLLKLDRLLAPEGELLISVPVETGLSVLIKQSVRRIAGWCGHAGYKETSRYTAREMISSIFARSSQHIVRPVYGEGADRWHDHKGFNWRALERQVGEQFVVERVASSPLWWLPPFVASQVWFRARRK